MKRLAVVVLAIIGAVGSVAVVGCTQDVPEDTQMRPLSARLDALEEQARALGSEGAPVWRELGELALDAEPTRALAAYREATRLDGGDFGGWVELARLERRHGGDLAAARLAAEAAARSAGDERERGAAASELGDILVLQGDLAEAKVQFLTTYKILEAALVADPSNAIAQRNVSVSLDRLGDVALASGDLAGAKELFTQSLEIRERLAAADPGSALTQRDVSVSLEVLGDVAVALGDLAGAKALFARSLEMREALAAADPVSAQALRDVSVGLEKLGDVAVEASDLAGARGYFTRSLEMRERLAAKSWGSARAQRDVIVSLDRLGDVTGDRAHWQRALDLALAMEAEGQLAPADAFIPGYLRGKLGG
jgi:tetratricopeptide (TPR) repeat protein